MLAIPHPRKSDTQHTVILSAPAWRKKKLLCVAKKMTLYVPLSIPALIAATRSATQKAATPAHLFVTNTAGHMAQTVPWLTYHWSSAVTPRWTKKSVACLRFELNPTEVFSMAVSTRMRPPWKNTSASLDGF